jgi:hypothetical protein
VSSQRKRDARDPRIGAFVVRGDELRTFEDASIIRYEAASGIVVIETAMPGGQPTKFEPAAWFKLEEGMLVGLGTDLRHHEKQPAEKPHLLLRGRWFSFGRARHYGLAGDVVTFQERVTPLTEYSGWPAEQIVYLLRLGPGDIFVDTNGDRPMELSLDRLA